MEFISISVDTINGSNVLDISRWLTTQDRVSTDLRERVLAAIKHQPGISYQIIEMMFDLRAEVFLKKLEAIN